MKISEIANFTGDINPLSYFWVVEYFDGTTLTQFDLFTGEETPWDKAHHKNKRISSVLWMPFTPQLASKVFSKSNTLCRCIDQDAMIRAYIPEGASIILKRKGFIEIGTGKRHRAYVLGFKLGKEISVMAKNDIGENINPLIVAKWMRGLSMSDSKGIII